MWKLTWWAAFVCLKVIIPSVKLGFQKRRGKEFSPIEKQYIVVYRRNKKTKILHIVVIPSGNLQSPCICSRYTGRTRL